MMRGKFNLIASVVAFALGAVYLFSDGASITANVIGAGSNNAGFASIIGIAMIIGSMILFEVSMNNADTQSLDLERLIRRTNNHEEIYDSKKADEEPPVELHRSQHAHEHHKH
jgi:hypothetical protein